MGDYELLSHVILTLDTQVSQKSTVYGNLKDLIKLALCKYEALCYTLVPWKLHLWAWLSTSTNINISSKTEQKTMVARYQTCYTNSNEGSIHESIWKN